MYILLLQDTGISVRKRVIKIFRDICVEHSDFEKIPEMCVKMIRRVNDEEGIKVMSLSVVVIVYSTNVCNVVFYQCIDYLYTCHTC